jgi:hypothetical protein
VPDEVVEAIEAQEELVRCTAKLIAEMTWAANHQAQEPLRDTDASRAAAAQAALLKAQTAKPKRGKWRKDVELRPLSLGGHDLQKNGDWWKCTVCKLQTRSWVKMAPKECLGSCARKWAEKAKQFADNGTVIGDNHTRAFSGEVVWCTRCGAYADNVAKGLSKPCQGHPNTHTVRCLKALKRGRHPRSGIEIGLPQYEVLNSSSKKQKVIDEQLPDAPPAREVQGMKRKVETIGPTTAERRAALLERVRAKEAKAKDDSQATPIRRRVSMKRKLSNFEELAFRPIRRYDG